jgi:hypothetical protein
MMYGLHIVPTNDQLIGLADADWGGESDHKSVSGFVITLGNVPVSWGRKKQTAVALSSTEAEYASLSEAAKCGRAEKHTTNRAGISIKTGKFCTVKRWY